MNAVLKLDKTRVKHSFSAASSTYDSVAQLQRSVGKELLHIVDTESLTGTLLDLGCGTGFLTTEVLRLVSNNIDLICVKPSPKREGWVTTAWMQEVEQRMEQLPRGNQNTDKSLFVSPHPNLLLHAPECTEGEGAIVLKPIALELTPRHANQPCIVALDIAWSMLHTSRTKLAGREGVLYLCADAEYLPLAGQSVDSVMSNLALQWCVNLAAVFADIKRVLKPDGRLVFSTFGPETLQELKAAWSGVDDYNHVNEFYSEEQLRHFLLQAGFSDIKTHRKSYLSRYDSVPALMHELKNIGAHNVTAGRNKNITSKTRMQQMIAAYEKYRVDGQIPATFDVILVSAS